MFEDAALNVLDGKGVTMADEEVKPVRVTKKRKSRPLEVENEDGTITNLTIREMTGTLRDRWMNQMGKAVKIDPTGKNGKIQDHTGLYAGLIAACCYNEKGLQLAEGEVQSWPASQQELVFEICQEMNGLTKKAEEAEKKD